MPECLARAWYIYTRKQKDKREKQQYSVYVSLRIKERRISYVVEKPDPCRNFDFLLDSEGVPGVRIEVYRHFYFGFVGESFDLCSSWLCH